MKTVIKVGGMMCEHCVMHVKNALKGLKGVEDAEVSLKDKKAVVTSKAPLNEKDIAKAIKEAGYRYEGIEK